MRSQAAEGGGKCGSVVGWGTMLQAEGRGLDPSWRHLIFQLTSSFQSHYSPGVDTGSNRYEYQES
jgi:hypothetical protein